MDRTCREGEPVTAQSGHVGHREHASSAERCAQQHRLDCARCTDKNIVSCPHVPHVERDSLDKFMHVTKQKNPEQKYVRPVASSHELGWSQKPLVKENPHFRKHGDLVGHCASLWSFCASAPLPCVLTQSYGAVCAVARDRFRRRMYDVTRYGEQYIQMVHASPHDRRGGARQ